MRFAAGVKRIPAPAGFLIIILLVILILGAPTCRRLAIAAKTIGNRHSSFETGGAVYEIGNHLPEGWVVDFGQVDVSTPIGEGPSYDGNGFADLNGYMRGGISVDILTVLGQSYTLSFAYARNPDSRTADPEVFPEAEISVNGSVLSGGPLAPTANNSWSNLQWQTVSYTVTATSTSTHLTFESLTEGASGVLVDAIDLAPN